jgi:hypothetical protein
MKKIFAILALAFAGTAFADSVTLESQNVTNDGSANQSIYLLGAKHDFNKNVAVDVVFSNAQTDGTKALSTRLETGLTLTQPVFGDVSGYVRTVYGQKYGNGTEFGYYSIEPGITAPIGPFNAKLGWRWRSATDTANGDQTHTVRATLAYPLTKNDTVFARYDRVEGDNTQKIVVIGYTRGF